MARRPGPSLTPRDVARKGAELVEEHGASALTLSRVAKALGVQTPSLYHHVAGSSGLHAAVAFEGWRLLNDRMPPLEGSVSDILRTWAFNYRDFALEHRGLYEIMAVTPLDWNDPLLVEMSTDFMGALAKSEIDAEDLIHLLRSLRAAVQGYLTLEMTGQFCYETGGTSSFDWMIDTFLQGCLSRYVN
jgi:AcrR family transcriptional regulator